MGAEILNDNDSGLILSAEMLPDACLSQFLSAKLLWYARRSQILCRYPIGSPTWNIVDRHVLIVHYEILALITAAFYLLSQIGTIIPRRDGKIVEIKEWAIGTRILAYKKLPRNSEDGDKQKGKTFYLFCWGFGLIFFFLSGNIPRFSVQIGFRT